MRNALVAVVATKFSGKPWILQVGSRGPSQGSSPAPPPNLKTKHRTSDFINSLQYKVHPSCIYSSTNFTKTIS